MLMLTASEWRSMKRIVGLLLLTTACVAAPPPPQSAAADDGDPYIRGTITSVSDRGVMVEEKPNDRSGSAKAMLRINDDTQIVSASGAPKTRADLRSGQRVSAWTTGQIMESYPVQATARKIVIH